MIPERGPDCDLCTPDMHYLLTCPICATQWDEPPCPNIYKCPKCFCEVKVRDWEHAEWYSLHIEQRPAPV